MTETKAPMVSVIMPVYNAGQYLQGAVDSVLAQTFTDFELLLVDDGSTDGSGKTCDEYARQDARVKALHKANGGICNARNYGLQAAGGKYIAFCDNDDKMLPNCLQLAVNKCEETACDVVRFRRRHFKISGKTVYAETPAPFAEQCVVVTTWKEYLNVINCCGYGVWAGFYRASFLQEHKITFDESIRYGYEDHVFTAQCCSSAVKICVVPDILYEWYQRNAQSTSCKRGRAIFENRAQALMVWKHIEDRTAQQCLRSEKEKTKRYYDYLFFYFLELYQADMRLEEKKRLLHSEKKQLGLDQGISYRGIGLYHFKKQIVAWCILGEHLRLYSILRIVYDTLFRGGIRGGNIQIKDSQRDYASL